MNKFYMLMAACAAMVVATGCASVQTASEKDMTGMKLTTNPADQAIAQVNADNFGFYLLSIPIFSGSTEKPGTMLFNQDTVTLANVTQMATAKCKDLGATKAIDMDSKISSMMIPLPIPFLFYLKEVQVSTNAIK